MKDAFLKFLLHDDISLFSFQLLQEVTSVEDYMENCKSALAPENVNKNRYSDVLPCKC